MIPEKEIKILVSTAFNYHDFPSGIFSFRCL